MEWIPLISAFCSAVAIIISIVATSKKQSERLAKIETKLDMMSAQLTLLQESVRNHEHRITVLEERSHK